MSTTSILSVFFLLDEFLLIVGSSVLLVLFVFFCSSFSDFWRFILEIHFSLFSAFILSSFNYFCILMLIYFIGT